MLRNMTVARELGFLKVPENTLIDLKEIEDYPDDQVLIISTGSQGSRSAPCPVSPTTSTR